MGEQRQSHFRPGRLQHGGAVDECSNAAVHRRSFSPASLSSSGR